MLFMPTTVSAYPERPCKIRAMSTAPAPLQELHTTVSSPPTNTQLCIGSFPCFDFSG